MKIYIEFIVLISFILLFILWWVWIRLSKYILLKKYKPENDKSRKGNIEIGGIANTEQSVANTDRSSSGYKFPEEQGNLPTATSNDSGKNRKGIRKLLRRRHRRN